MNRIRIGFAFLTLVAKKAAAKMMILKPKIYGVFDGEPKLSGVISKSAAAAMSPTMVGRSVLKTSFTSCESL